jgi:hypothetical protein
MKQDIEELNFLGFHQNFSEQSSASFLKRNNIEDIPAAISHVMDWSVYFHEALPELEETSNLLRRVIV